MTRVIQIQQLRQRLARRLFERRFAAGLREELARQGGVDLSRERAWAERQAERMEFAAGVVVACLLAAGAVYLWASIVALGASR